MALVDVLRKFGLLSNPPRFKVGDHVQTAGGGPLMIVQSIEPIRKTGNYLIVCKWFDKDTQASRTNLFPEELLVSFDWYNPK